MKKLLIASLMCTSLTLCLRGQDDWHTYPFREISALLQGEEKLYKETGGRAEMVISAKPFPAKTLVTFTGSKRTASSYTQSYIKIWFETRGQPPENASDLVEEYLFKEKGKEYWLPVVSKVAKALPQELKPGEEVTIYYFYLGGLNPGALQLKEIVPDKTAPREENAMRWILAVERVEKPRKDFAGAVLESAIDRSMETPGKITDIWFDPRQVKLKAKVVFTGDVRLISGKRKRLKDLWFENHGFPPRASDLMQNEGRFLEGDKEYWIALRNRTLEHIQDNVKNGDSLFLNTILAGAVRDAKQVDWLFMAGEYSR